MTDLLGLSDYNPPALGNLDLENNKPMINQDENFNTLNEPVSETIVYSYPSTPINFPSLEKRSQNDIL